MTGPPDTGALTNRTLRILVVEDDPDTLETLIALLEGMGHWAAGCSSAELALSRYLEGAFDIVITDVELPGISGRELAATLSLEGGIPIIFATGRPAPDVLPPRSSWLRKPFTVEQLSAALDEAMGGALPPPAAS